MPEAVVLDAYAVLAFLDDEPGAEAVAEVLRSGEPWMTSVNLGEVTALPGQSRLAAFTAREPSRATGDPR